MAVTKLRNKQTGQIIELQFYTQDYRAYPPDVWEVLPADSQIPITGE